MADGGAGKCAYARPDRCPRAGMAGGGTDQRAGASAEQTAQHGPFTGMSV